MPAAPAPVKQNGQSPAVEPKPHKTIRAYLEAAKDRLAASLPKHLTPERMIQVVSVIDYHTPKLKECDNESILACVIRASSLGLDLSPGMNEASLIPRKDWETGEMHCTFMMGYQGLKKLVMNTGQVAVFRTDVVREGDVFFWGYNPDLYFEHQPIGDPEGPILKAYAYAKLANGERMVEVMSRSQIEKIRDRSDNVKNAKKYGKKTPWDTDEGEMFRKTVSKRLSKSLPRSHELADAIYEDDAEYRVEPVDEAPPTIPQSRSKALALRLPSLPPPDVEDEPESEPEPVQAPVDPPAEPPTPAKGKHGPLAGKKTPSPPPGIADDDIPDGAYRLGEGDRSEGS